MLQNKVVFISDGTGYLGSAICKACIDYGAQVSFSYFEKKEQAKDLMNELTGIEAVQIDFKNIHDIKTKIETLYKKVDTVDILINNAGASQIMPFSLLEEDDFDFILDVNVKGTFFLTKAIVRRMIKYKRGTIVNIGSIAGHRMFDVHTLCSIEICDSRIHLCFSC